MSEPEDVEELARVRELQIDQARKRIIFRQRALHEATFELEELLRS